MIGLQDQQIVTLARQDLLGNRALAAHRAQSHDAVLQSQPPLGEAHTTPKICPP
jgi:hypothetical protein